MYRDRSPQTTLMQTEDYSIVEDFRSIVELMYDKGLVGLISDRTGVSRATISQIRYGNTMPNLYTIEAMLHCMSMHLEIHND